MMEKVTPVTARDQQIKSNQSSRSEIAKFVKAAGRLNTSGNGRLIFAMDATMSRQPTWDRACSIQSRMFEAVNKINGLSVQLVYFRGYGECRASKWVVNSQSLAELMTGIDCRGGKTQIGKVLLHAAKEAKEKPVSSLVFVGDAMEEDIDQICHKAGQLAMKGVKAFMFQEGNDPVAERAFREVARLTKGAYMRLGTGSADDLAELLSAVAVYASGGMPALQARKGRKDQLLIEQLNSAEESKRNQPGR